MPPRSRTAPGAPRVAIILSTYNRSITDRLLQGALAAFQRDFPAAPPPPVFHAPGAFELVFLSHTAAASARFEGVLALGCVIQGQTDHHDYINHAVAQGLVHAALHASVPVAFGLLTVKTPAQARARAGGSKGNKGDEAMSALLATITTARDIRSNARPASSTRARPDKAAAGPTR